MPFCSNCGRQATTSERFCSSCGHELALDAGPGTEETAGADPSRLTSVVETPPPPPGSSTPPDNHLAKAIISTIICCMPLGIVAIVHASRVNGRFLAGDIAVAELNAKKANDWGNWSIALGFIGGLLYFIVVMIAGVVDS